MGFAIAGGIAAAGIIGSVASSNAAGSQRGAADQANATQQSMFNTQQANEAPYLAAGKNALGQIQANMGYYNQPFTMANFQQDPGYQFDLQQGQQAIQRSAAAKGGLVGGQALTALNDYSQNMASNEFQNAYNRYTQNQSNSYNRLASLAGLGQTAVSGVNAAGSNAANNIGANQIGAGNATAAGQIGVANSITGAIGSGLNQYQGYQTLNALNPNSGGQTNASAGINSGFANGQQLTMPPMNSSSYQALE